MTYYVSSGTLNPTHSPSDATDQMTDCLRCVAEAPSFIRSPPLTVKIAETQSASLPCDVVGTPSPDVAWKTGSPPGRLFPLFYDDSDADRFVVNASGDLLIKVARQTNGFRN